MEPNSWASSDQQEDVEDLLANIVALRGHLKKTEKTLQDLGEQLYRYNCMELKLLLLICLFSLCLYPN